MIPTKSIELFLCSEQGSRLNKKGILGRMIQEAFEGCIHDCELPWIFGCCEAKDLFLEIIKTDPEHVEIFKETIQNLISKGSEE